MPSSGFKQRQTAHLRAFLSDCAEDLRVECVRDDHTFADGLRKEIKDIQLYRVGLMNPLEEAVLSLVFAFYSRVLKLDPGSQEAFRLACNRALDEIEREIQAIDVLAT